MPSQETLLWAVVALLIVALVLVYMLQAAEARVRALSREGTPPAPDYSGCIACVGCAAPIPIVPDEEQTITHGTPRLCPKCAGKWDERAGTPTAPEEP